MAALRSALQITLVPLHIFRYFPVIFRLSAVCLQCPTSISSAQVTNWPAEHKRSSRFELAALHDRDRLRPCLAR